MSPLEPELVETHRYLVFPGISHPNKPVSIKLDNSAALSIGEPSLYDDASRDSPDGASSLGDSEDHPSKISFFFST